ncbi:DEKNAAC105044 [Brettanomyces naardenensis]|uniref:DEKNAAC105044 n=1 Tax=Brettanomyces naardenensis TaxID=13370 RepID=A0A448YS11_BRENA|nr:DEKNAAC105044 [Brettanomyces naardenensis]
MSNGNPILAQIPLIVAPGSYQRPKAVTLPYDFEQLPVNLDEYNARTLKPVRQSFESIKQDEKNLIEKLDGMYSDDDKKKFLFWENSVRMMAPGYIGQDGSVGVMSPTKKRN